jgi:hypothetical protein
MARRCTRPSSCSTIGTPAGYVMSEAELDEVFESALVERGFMSRDHEEARAGSRPGGPAPVPRGAARAGRRHPDLRRARVRFNLAGDRIRGRWDRVDLIPLDPESVADAIAYEPDGAAGRTWSTRRSASWARSTWTITDYKSSDVRDPVKARQRARESLQLQIYAMGYEAMTGRLPDEVALHFLESGLVGRVPVDRKRLAKARERIGQAAAGIRARDYTPSPSTWPAATAPSATSVPSSVAR